VQVLISIVSHEQGSMAQRCLDQIHIGFAAASTQRDFQYKTVLVHNVAEPKSFANDLLNENLDTRNSSCISAIERWNTTPLGFAQNHNRVLLDTEASTADWFLIVNPDIEWHDKTAFSSIVRVINEVDSKIAAISIDQRLPSGVVVQYARCLITPWQLLLRTFSRIRGTKDALVAPSKADWLNGACLLVRRQAFERLGGFDERYRLYCEDVDFCLRLRLAGWKLAVLDVTVIHDTRRDSARKWGFLLWHFHSLCKLWTSKAFWQFLWWRAKRRDSIVELNYRSNNKSVINACSPPPRV
jgi:N-acetylglucosaminyl-diphospho-decaprenol L-rhamnosyltransferase